MKTINLRKFVSIKETFPLIAGLLSYFAEKERDIKCLAIETLEK